jgi:uncharacterized membrane protein
MNDFIKKNWMNMLGGLFLFAAMLYFFNLIISEGWLPPAARVAIGLLAGTTLIYYGYAKFKLQANLAKELLAGLGSAIVYATFAYASFSIEINWSVNAIIIAMLSFTGLITFIGYTQEMRKFSFIALFGGLITPIVLKAPEQQVFVLFVYVLILNSFALYLSAVKRWPELRLMSFLVTVTIYVTYYIYFEPLSWQKPMFYVSVLFIVYFVGLLIAGFTEREKFDGLNLWMNIINAINYVFWSIFILNSFTVPYALPTLLVGALFIVSSAFVQKRAGMSAMPTIFYFLLGVILISISGSELAANFESGGMHHVINVSIWLFLTVIIFLAGSFAKVSFAKYLALAAWVFTFVYWYAVAWDVEWVKWFGLTYIPFLNPGALVWIGLAITGFVFSDKFRPDGKDHGRFPYENRNDWVALALALASHSVVGGLLTIQIQNTWEAYELQFVSVNIFLSISWMVYALSLFAWGAYSDQLPFRFMGSAVVVLTSIKVFFEDIRGSSNIYIALFLLIIGLLVLLIARIDRYWREKHHRARLEEMKTSRETGH